MGLLQIAILFFPHEVNFFVVLPQLHSYKGNANSRCHSNNLAPLNKIRLAPSTHPD